MVEQHSETVDIGADARRMPVEHLGREIERGAGDGLALDAATRTACAEVHQHDPAAFFAHHVVRLDVAVREAGTMDRGERPAEVLADRGSLPGAQPSALAELFFEVPAVNQLHPGADAPIVLVCAVDLHHVLVADSRERPGLAQQPCAALGPADPIRLEQLEGDIPIEIGVVGAVDLGEGALAETPQQNQRSPTAQRLHPHRPRRRIP